MKKKLISWLLLLCLLITPCSAVHASTINTNDLETDVSVQIEQMVSQLYAGQVGQYTIGNAITIYNADTACVYYIIPIFRDQECVGTVELDVAGNVTLTDEVTLYTNITKLESSAYLLYTSGGIVYAEIPGEVIELYNSGFNIPSTNDFTLLPYLDKVASAEVCLDTTRSSLNISAVVENTKLTNIVTSGITPREQVPVLETKRCSITDFVEQGRYNICWAACVATIANYKKAFSLSAAQVATEMGHNYTHKDYAGATADQTKTALAKYGLSYSIISGKPSWSKIKNYISKNRPFIVGLKATSSNDRHMITGYGYGCQTGDPDTHASTRYVQLWDPNGAKITFTYNATSFSLGGYSWKWSTTLVN